MQRQLSNKIIFLWATFFILCATCSFFYPRDEIFKNFEEFFTYYWILGFFSLVLICIFHTRHILIEWIKPLLPQSRWEWAIFLAIQGLCTLVILTHVDPMLETYYDEPAYLATARQMFDSHRALGCNEGDFWGNGLTCWSTFFNAHAHLPSFLISLAYLFLGNQIGAVFVLNYLLFLFTGWLIFIISRRLTLDSGTSLIAMFTWLTWPIVIIRSLSGGSEITASVSQMFCLLLTLFYLDQRKNKTPDSSNLWIDVLFGTTLGLSGQARLDSPLFLVVIALPALLQAGHLTYLFGFLSFIPSLVMRRILKDYTGNSNVLPYFGFEKFRTNFPDNLSWLFDFQGHQRYSQPLIIIFSLLGTILFYTRLRKDKDIGIHAFPLTPLLGLFFYSCLQMVNFKELSAITRLSVVLFSASSIMFGLFIFYLASLKNHLRKLLTFCVSFLIFLSFLLNLPMLASGVLRGDQPPRLEDQFIISQLSIIGKRSVFFTPYGETILSHGYSAFSYSQLQAMDNESHSWWTHIKTESEDNIYYIKGWECYLDPGDTRYMPYDKPWVKACDEIENKYLLQEKARSHTRNGYDIVMYQIKGFKKHIK